MLLVVSHNSKEVIFNSIKKNRNKGQLKNLRIECLTTSQLLNETNISDEIIQGKAKINWDLYKKKKLIKNHPRTFLLNRNLGNGINFEKIFTKKESYYAQKEFEAYLGFAFNAFTSMTGNALPDGRCASFYSLPNQWNKTMHSCKEKILVPNYIWSSDSEDYKKFNPEHAVYSQLFNFGNWKIGKKPEKQTEVPLVFNRPPGKPVFLTQLWSEGYTTTYDNHELPETTLKRILTLGPMLSHIFQYAIFEALLFVQNDCITFGAITPSINFGQNNKNFDAVLQKALLKKLQLVTNYA